MGTFGLVASSLVLLFNCLHHKNNKFKRDDIMIIGSLVAIGISIWFYLTAKEINKKPVHWAMAGFMVYFIVGLIWTYFINPSIKEAFLHNRSWVLMMLVRYAHIVVALGVTVAFNRIVGKKPKYE